MATKTEILNEIEPLEAHCRPPPMNELQRAGWLRDWCADLAEFPIEAIAAGCRKWRHSGSTKFPTPGQLLPLIRAELPQRREAVNAEPWRPISDAEYEALKLPEKIRHHRILAHDARRKAGPMWVNGKHCTAEEMPEGWRRWNEQAERHEAEAARLTKYLRHSVVAAE